MQESSNWTGNQTFNLSNAGSTPVSCTKECDPIPTTHALRCTQWFKHGESIEPRRMTAGKTAQNMQLQSNWIRLFPVTEDDASSNLVGCANLTADSIMNALVLDDQR